MTAPGPRIRVLVADDDAVDRATIRRHLTAAGEPVDLDEIDDARDLVARAADDRYDCIILDHVLPGETAFDVIARLRQAGIDTPVLCVTGHDEEVGAALVMAGAHDFMVKEDLSPSRLARRLRYVVRLGRAERQARRVRAELDAQRRLLDAVIAQLPSGVAVTDLSIGTVLVANPGGHQLVTGDTGHAPTQARAALAEAASRAAPVAADDTVVHADRELRISAHPVVVGGRPVAAMVVADDVTELVAARRTAERAAQAREDVLAIVGHDLRGPLSAINVAVDALADPALGDDERARYVGAVRRSVARADRLIDDLLTAHRIEQGALRVTPRPVEVRALLDQAVREHELVADRAGTRLAVEVPDDVGRVNADPGALARVLANLIGNALRHARGTEVIELSARRDRDTVELTVRDHGPGITAEALPHVFDRYWQGRTRRTGSGLGLAIVRGIARAHGGDVTVDTPTGGGARFTVRLPGA